MLKTYRLFLVLIVASLIIGTCANERAISGGEEDKTAPQIIFSTPENESVGTGVNVEIFIKFSEQMKKTTVSAALQIWPRPPGEYELKTGWTWLKLTFNEPLDPDVTYLLTLDKSAQDLRGNGLDATYILAFSTGDSLNSGRLAGFIYGPQDIKKNGDLLLYRDFESSLSELRQLPADYIFQPNDNGSFELPYLAERSYMLFYHWDRNRNKLIDGDDYFGRPEQASVQARTDSIAEVHELWPHLRPLERVKLLEVSELEEQLIQIRTDRPMSEAAIKNFDLFADGVKIPVLGTSLVTEDEFAGHINIAIPLLDSAQIWLQQFQDTSGFELHTDTLIFRTETEFDTLGLEDLSVQWGNDSQLLFPGQEPSIRINSNLPLILKSDSAFQLVDSQIDTLPIPGKLQMLSSMVWSFDPDTVLADGHTYKWQIRTDQLHIPLNGRDLDSLMLGDLRIMSSDSLGSLRVMHLGEIDLICVLKGKDIEKTFKLKSGLPQVIENLPAQNYTLSAYTDSDGDGKYNSGGLGPAAGSEPFLIYPTKIRVRARWETDLGVWELE